MRLRLPLTLLFLAVLTVVSFTPEARADGSTYSTTVLADTPVGYWKLNEGAAPLADSGSSGSVGSLSGGATLGVAGPAPDITALDLNGTTGYANVPYTAALNSGGDFTIEAWIRRSAGGTGDNQNIIVSKDNVNTNYKGYILNLDTSNRIAFCVGGATAFTCTTTTTTTVAASTWTQVGADVRSTGGGNYEMRIFVNGALAQSHSFTAAPVANVNGPFRIGNNQINGKYFQGQIAQVSYHSSALGPTKMASRYASLQSSPINTAVPVVTGTAQVGQTVSTTDGTWSNSPTGYTYQWQGSQDGSNWSNLVGATSSTFVIPGGIVGYSLRSVVTASNTFGAVSANSSATAFITNSPPANTTPPAVSGTQEVGQTLTASTGSWTGSTPMSYTFQWQRSPDGSSWTNIASATFITYTLTGVDSGQFIRANVTATNSVAATAAATAQTGAITTPSSPPVNTAVPAANGSAQDGQTLTAADGTWTGSPVITYSHQWQTAAAPGGPWSDIVGQTASTLALGPGDVGNYIRVGVTGTNGFGASTAYSPATVQVTAANTAPVNTVLPTVSGTEQEGQTLSGANGTWTGTPVITYGYQWQSSPDGSTWTNIAGATGINYVPVAGDVGDVLRLGVTGTNGTGSNTAYSVATGIIAAAPGTPPVNTSVPTLSGTAQDGQSLLAADGTWTGTAVISYTYQWQTAAAAGGPWSDIAGQTAASIALGAGDVGDYIRVAVTGTNGFGAATAYSAASAQVVAAGTPPVNTVLPTLSGTAQDGQTLTAANGTWTGTAVISYTHQWQTATAAGGPWSDIVGQTASTLALGAGDVGDYIRVAVTGTNGFGAATAYSAASAQVAAAGTPPVNTSIPTLSGTAQDGQTLTAADGTWTGTAVITYSYQWQDSPDGSTWTNIAGQTALTLALDAGDVGNYFRVGVTGTNGFGNSTAYSASSAQVTAALTPPVNTVLPTVTGTAQDGVVLSGANGTWTGSPVITYTYQWQDSPDGSTWANIAGATSINYTPVTADVGNYLRLGVTGTNGAGNATAHSAATAQVIAAGTPPVNTVLPTLSGTAQDGQTLTAANGTWTGTAVITYTYQWQDSPDGSTWTNIAGQTASTLALGAGNVGDYIRVAVTGTNAYGNATAYSAASAQVIAAGVPPVNTVIPTLSGTAQDGQTLTAANGTWTGTAVISYAHQWQDSPDGSTWTNIAGQTASTLALGPADVGNYIRVAVTGTNAYGNATAYSASSAQVVVAGTPPLNTVIPTTAGIAQDGQTLTSANGTWTGSPVIGFSYQWQTSPDGSTWSALAGQTASSLVLGAGDVGNYIRVAVTGTNAFGNDTAYSASTAQVIAAGSAPVNTVIPTLSGTESDGQTLTAANGTWTGTAVISYTHQWQTATAPGGPWSNLAGATSSTYLLTPGDVGDYIRVGVTGTNGFGASTAYSAASGVISGAVPVNTSLPLLSGTAQDGQALSTTDGTWTGSAVISYSYKWQSAAAPAGPFSDIAGATASSYTIQSADVGNYLRSAVTGTNGFGNDTAYSAVSAQVVGTAPINTVIPSFTGTAEDGQVLSGSDGSWTGTPVITYASQWQTAAAPAGPFTDIPGATAANYTILSGDIGTYLRLKITATNGDGSSVAYSNSSAQVGAVLPANTVIPVVTGTAQDGQVLTTDNGSWTGSPTINFTYQWESSPDGSTWSAIPGETASVYVITSSQIGNYLRSGVIADNAAGNSTAYSLSTAQVVGIAPFNTVVPAISGTAADGQTLTGTTGTWGGTAVITYGLQWQSGPAPGGPFADIAGATASTYVIPATEVGNYIRLKATATNGSGSTDAFSSATLQVAGNAPINTSVPALSGTAASGQVMSGTDGTWTGSPVIGFSYQWQTAAAPAGPFANIGGATASSYTIVNGDIGNYLRLAVTGTNGFGNATAYSAASAQVAGIPPVNTVLPSLSGTAADGSLLTAADGTWTGSPVISYTYQWQSGAAAGGPFANIGGATAATYSIPSSEVGNYLRVAVTATNSAGSGTAFSAASAQVAGVAPTNTAVPTLSGTAQDGQVMTAAPGSWSGTPAISYGYQWQSAAAPAGPWANIAGETATTYMIQGAQVGNYLRVAVTGLNAWGSSTAYSAASAQVVGNGPVNTSIPALAGAAQDGQTLTGTDGTWTGSPLITYTYQWQSAAAAAGPWANLPGEIAASHAVGSADIGNYLRLAVTATNGFGSNTAYSAASAQVVGTPPVNTVVPTFAGVAQDTQTLTAANGTWTGSPVITYSYQWQSGAAAGGPFVSIGGATAATYVIPSAQVGNYLRLEVTATNAAGSSAAFSAVSAQVTGIAPANTALPVLGGTAADGQTLSVTTGTFSGTPALSYTYQWQSAAAPAGPYANIGGATASTYVIPSGQVGNYLRAAVTATNAWGAATAYSAASAQVAGNVPVNTSIPSLSGTAQDTQTLSGADGTWSGSPVITFAYQWQSAAAPAGPYANIGGATASTYVIPSGQVGNYLRLAVTATNGFGSDVAYSAASAQVVGTPPVNTVIPSFAGTAQDTQTLTAANGTWTGSPVITYSYQWQSGAAAGGPFANIAGATASTYVVPSAQVGNYLRLEVTATNGSGSSSAFSAVSAQVTGIAPANTVLPALSGTAADGQTLSVTNGTFTGTPALSYTYQWQSAAAPAGPYANIGGATASTYVIPSGQVGNYLRAAVTATNAWGADTAYSAASAQVAGNVPVNTSIPSISGTAQDTQTLSGTDGTWTGSPVITYSYQWQSAAAAAGPYANIGGATASTYVIPSAQIGNYLRLAVTATNGFGSDVAYSAASAQVAGTPPVNTVVPSFAGAAQDTQTLTAADGTWTGSPVITYSYQWQSGAAAGGPFANIGGATASTYVIPSAQVGNYLRLEVTATNAAGSSSAFATVSAQVTGIAPANTALPVLGGTAADGQTLSVTNGTFSGTPALSYTYQWQSAAAAAGPYANIGGATASTYVIPTGQVGNYLRAAVTATNAWGADTAYSAASAQVAGNLPVNTSISSLSGTAADGQTLSGTDGTWTGSPVITYTYQWQSAAAAAGPYANIGGATASTYVIPTGQVGNYLRLAVTGTNGFGSDVAYSAASAQVAGNSPVNTSVPTFTGTAADGQTLTGADGTWTGSPVITFAYQWQSGAAAGGPFADIGGATASTYVIPSGQIGNYLRLKVTGTNGAGSDIAYSTASAQVAGNPPLNTVAPTLSGAAQDTQTLTAADGTWTGSPTITYSYQWQSGAAAGGPFANIGGATASTYVIPSTEIGNYLRVAVTGTSAHGSDVAYSVASAQVTGLAPANSAVPVVSGTLADGQTISSTLGSWSGSPTITYGYQWQSSPDGTTWSNIGGATSSTYVIVTGDIGSFLRSTVTGTNPYGATTANSAATAAVGGTPPVNTVAPALSGSAVDGQTISTTDGTWTGSPTITYTYQWQSGPSAAGPWSNIAGATSSSYSIPTGQIGNYLRAAITGTNGAGAATAYSTASAQVNGAAPVNSAVPVVTGTPTDGQLLSTTDGTWSGSPTISYTYQWQSAALLAGPYTNIAGATSSTYTLTPTELTRYVRSAVTGTSPYGAATAYSVGVGPVASLIPANTAAPQITGIARVAGGFVATDGTWTGSPTIVYSYQWERCNVALTVCTAVGTNSNAYTAVIGDLGSRLRIQVTATNTAGAVTQASAASDIIVSQTLTAGSNLDTNATKAAGTTLVLTLGAGASIGQTVVVSTAHDATSAATISAVDSKGNAYTSNFVVPNGTNTVAGTLSALVTTALVAGDTITITWTGGTPSVRAAGATAFNGIRSDSATRADGTQSGTGNSGAPSTANLVTTLANEILIGAISVEGSTGDVFTAGAGWTGLPVAGTTGGSAASNNRINREYRIVAATGSYSATATISSRRWAAGIVGFRAPVSKTW